MKKLYKLQVVTLICLLNFSFVKAQMITGVWKGKINRQKVEVKIIQNGDSLTGTTYYYESENNYRRYSIKGYFDSKTNAAVWWDDKLLEEKSSKFNLAGPGKNALLSSADFNCPGSGRIMLDGKTSLKDDDNKLKGEVHLDKTATPVFEDDWDYVIDNYTTGANNPDIINSIAENIPRPKTNEEPEKTIIEEREKVIIPTPVQKPIEKIAKKTEAPKEKPIPVLKTIESVPVPTIEEKFISRKKILIKEIPITGDSIELRFYDNAEIDGDSISLFLNDKLIFQHIRLLASAYTIKLAVSELKESNELIMVAENLGSIPPNTSYMVAIVGDKQYDARLESTEGSSAMVKFIKKL